MGSSDRAASDRDAAVYYDFEKVYRVLGYYDGQEMMPLENLERHVDVNLERSLRSSQEYIRRIQFQLEMLEVLAEGRAVFRTDKPELSLVYTLFSEGIQALIALRELDASDLKDWCLLVKSTLKNFDEGATQDLASLLWRSPSRNIRTRIYNSLSDYASGSEKPKEPGAEGPAAEAEVTEVKSFHRRDLEWDVPEASKVDRLPEAQEKLSKGGVERVRSRIESLEIQSEVPDELRLSPLELNTLADELSFFDQNHVDFNLLNWQMQYLSGGGSDSQGFQSACEQMALLSSKIVSRFHPGLLYFLLQQVQGLSGNHLSPLRSRIETEIKKTLRMPANEKRLLGSLKDPERARVAKRLFPYLDSSQFASVIDFYLAFDDKDGLVEFLKVVIQQNEEVESLFFSWGNERLYQILPLFRRLDWPKKYVFLKRAIRSASPKIVKQASYYIVNIPFEAQLALDTYLQLSDEVKEIWMRAFCEQPVASDWILFFEKLFSSGAWMQAKSTAFQTRLMMGWAEAAIRVAGPRSLPVFDPWIKSRKWHLWPKFPEARSILLSCLLSKRELRSAPEVQEVFRSELSVMFQPKSLKLGLKKAVGS